MLDIKRPIIIIGHKNPDTDSVCSAIAYANLKRIITKEKYEAKRAGYLNEETQFVLDKFGVKSPEYVEDVRTQVKDIEIRKTQGVTSGISLKKAWTLMKDNNVVTLPITKENEIEGLITIGDIAESYMDVYDSTILSTANTKYENIVGTLEATMVVGDIEEHFSNGKVLIAAANPDMMENYIEPGDLVILGNRYESQLCAIEMNAGCLIVCEGANISITIKKQAQEHNCKVISTPHDTYTVARLINQSMPISYFMRTENLITFRIDDYIENIQQIMAKKRHRDFPILDNDGKYVGMISRRNLLGANKKRLILVDHNEKSQAVFGMDNAEILEIIDHHRLGTVETMSPVFFRNQPLGCTATIIYQMYQENGVPIDKLTAALLCSAIISDTLMYRSPTCTVVDKLAAEELSKIAELDVEAFSKEMFRAGSNLSSKTAKEIFYQDFKKFSVNELSLGVGQINSMDADELIGIKKKIIPYMDHVMTENGLNMVFFMLTDIMTETSEVVFTGKNASMLIESAFGVKSNQNMVLLPGVVSRKKQLLPLIMEAIQQ